MPSLLDLPIPTRPRYFGPDGCPPGVVLQLTAFGTWAIERTKIRPRVGVVHTNAASVESQLQGQINWGNASANNTKPHYAVNRPQPTKLLRTDLRAIANSTGSDIETRYGERDSSFWSIAIETADSGYNADPGISDFLYDHAEIVARIMAYESIVWNIPIVVPTVWNSTGWVTHTWPFPYPYFTTAAGKTCPGAKKKATFREQLIPRAAQLVRAWTTAPVVPPKPAPVPTPEEPMTPRFFKTPGSPSATWVTTDGVTAARVTGVQFGALGHPAVETLTVTEARKFAYSPSLEHDMIGL